MNSSRTTPSISHVARGELKFSGPFIKASLYCSALRRLRAVFLWVDDTQGRRSVVILRAGRAPLLYHYVICIAILQIRQQTAISMIMSKAFCFSKKYLSTIVKKMLRLFICMHYLWMWTWHIYFHTVPVQY